MITAYLQCENGRGYLLKKVTQGSFERGGKQYNISSGFMCNLNPEVMFFGSAKIKNLILLSTGFFLQRRLLSFGGRKDLARFTRLAAISERRRIVWRRVRREWLL